MKLCSGAPFDTGSPAAGRNPPDGGDVGTDKGLVEGRYFKKAFIQKPNAGIPPLTVLHLF